MAAVKATSETTPTRDDHAAVARGDKKRTANVSGIVPKRANAFVRIFASLRSVKTWVQLWLGWMALTVVLALIVVDREPAVWAFYVAVGGVAIFNGALLLYQRGFSRLLAIPHLPFFPAFVAVAIVRLATTSLEGQLTFESDGVAFVVVVVLVITFTVCSLFDIHDTIACCAGSTYVFGSVEAYEAGASNLSAVIVADDLARQAETSA